MVTLFGAKSRSAGSMTAATAALVVYNFKPKVFTLSLKFLSSRHKVNKFSTMSTEAVLKFTRLSENAFPPVKGSERAAGFDLKSAYEYVVSARGKALVQTDLQLEVPAGCYGRLAPRSGLALKHFIDVGAGVIDEDYRGNVGVVLFNHSDREFIIHRGDRVAQLICEKIEYPALQELSALTDTSRGDAGFGSTGTN